MHGNWSFYCKDENITNENSSLLQKFVKKANYW